MVVQLIAKCWYEHEQVGHGPWSPVVAVGRVSVAPAVVDAVLAVAVVGGDVKTLAPVAVVPALVVAWGAVEATDLAVVP